MGVTTPAGDYAFGFLACTNAPGMPVDCWMRTNRGVDGSTIDVRIKQGDLLTGLEDTTGAGDERVGNSVGGSAHLLISAAIPACRIRRSPGFTPRGDRRSCTTTPGSAGQMQCRDRD